MVDTRRSLGNYGEKIAENFLNKKGFVLVDRQVRTPFGEVDLLMKEGSEWIFVEVKTRSGKSGVYPETSITKTKIKHMERTALYLLETLIKKDVPWRLDVVAVTLIDGKNPEVIHYPAIDGPCQM